MKSYQAILGTLTARTGIHVGTGKGGEISDDLCRRTAGGDYVIPGTAIAGALRTLVTRLAPRLGSPRCRALWSPQQLRQLKPKQAEEPCNCWTCQLFGDINPGEATQATASRLFVAHAKAILPTERLAHIRDQVGIDRVSRTSARAASAKFDLEVLPISTTFDLRLELEQTGNEMLDQRNEYLLAAVLAEWCAGRAWLGGRVARGLGALQLDQVRRVYWKLDDTAEVVAFLKDDHPWEKKDKADDRWLDPTFRIPIIIT